MNLPLHHLAAFALFATGLRIAVPEHR